MVSLPYNVGGSNFKPSPYYRKLNFPATFQRGICALAQPKRGVEILRSNSTIVNFTTRLGVRFHPNRIYGVKKYYTVIDPF